MNYERRQKGFRVAVDSLERASKVLSEIESEDEAEEIDAEFQDASEFQHIKDSIERLQSDIRFYMALETKLKEEGIYEKLDEGSGVPENLIREVGELMEDADGS
jgi:hypothetical protein